MHARTHTKQIHSLLACMQQHLREKEGKKKGRKQSIEGQSNTRDEDKPGSPNATKSATPPTRSRPSPNKAPPKPVITTTHSEKKGARKKRREESERARQTNTVAEEIL